MPHKLIINLAGVLLAALLPIEQGQAALITSTGGNLSALAVLFGDGGAETRSETTVKLTGNSFLDNTTRSAVAEATIAPTLAPTFVGARGEAGATVLPSFFLADRLTVFASATGQSRGALTSEKVVVHLPRDNLGST